MIDPKSMSISYQLAHVAYRARGLANAALASGAPRQTLRVRLVGLAPHRGGASQVDVRTLVRYRVHYRE